MPSNNNNDTRAQYADTRWFRAAASYAARNVGTRGRGKIPDIPWCQRSDRPHQQFCELVHGGRTRMLKNLLGVLEAAVVFGGLAGLVTGMYLLATSPLPGVTVMLGSMAILVSSVKKLGEAQKEWRKAAADRELSCPGRAGCSGE